MVKIQLVGTCNNDKFNQVHFGYITTMAFNETIMVLREDHPFRISLVEKTNSSYEFTQWCNGTGIRIRKEKDGIWLFTTGLNPYSSGSSGTLINGGPEMEQIYNSLVVPIYT